MKRSLSVIALAIAMVFSTPAAYAYNGEASAALSIKRQADTLIAAVDENALMADAMANVVDDSVPSSIRERIGASAEFISADTAYNDEIEVEVNSTVQKVGEIDCGDGDTANLYVAVAAAELKTDSAANMKLGANAWTYVYWFDHEGPENELYAIKARWDTSDCPYAVYDKVVKYGVVDPVVATLWLDGPTFLYLADSIDDYYLLCREEYYGLTFKCVSEVEIGNYGTLVCVAYSLYTT